MATRCYGGSSLRRDIGGDASGEGMVKDAE